MREEDTERLHARWTKKSKLCSSKKTKQLREQFDQRPAIIHHRVQCEYGEKKKREETKITYGLSIGSKELRDA